MRRTICIILLGLITFAAFSQHRRPVIAFTSDTQEPLWMEKILRKPNHNKLATKMIFKDALKLHPSALFILGDVVSLGYKSNTWRNIDAYTRSFADDSIPVYATLGNHELMYNAIKGTKNFQKRFPMYQATGYAEIVDSVAIILLNSNFSKMTATEILAQDKWYTKTVENLDEDTAIKFIVVGCHHSPYTNSQVVKPSIAVRQGFVPVFIHSKKGLLFLSGHSHNFEHFKVQGKHFLVIGGGGGVHQALYANEVTPDLNAAYKPAFHYLLVERVNDGVQVTSRRLKSDFTGFDNALTFILH